MITYKKIGEDDDFSNADRIRLEKPVVIEGEKHREVTLAYSQNFNSDTAVFIDDDIVVEEKTPLATIYRLVKLSENLEVEVVEK